MDSSRRKFLAAIAVSAALAPLSSVEAKPAHRWGMIIDLNRCYGCQSCTLACRSALPLKGLWRTKILEKETGCRPTFTPMLCQQCPMPDCLAVCATKALVRDSNGILRVRADLCVGCGQCVTACRYGMIGLSGKKAHKCELCTDIGKTPPCVESCSSHARLFGDFLHPEGEFGKALADPTLTAIEGTVKDGKTKDALICYIPLREGGAVCGASDVRL